jgi:hypothetical protein
VKRSSIVVAVLALLVLGAGAYLVFLSNQRSLPVDPLATVPADSFGVVRIKVDRVLASDAYKRLVVERGGAKGVEHVVKTCGFNPLENVKELVVFARPAPQGGMPRFAFSARGDLDPEKLGECVKKFGDGVGELKREDIEGVPAVVSSRGTSRAAFLSDGIVGGDADSVVAAINTLVGKAPSLAGDVVLHSLYAQFDSGTDIAGVARMPDEARALVQALAQNMIGVQLGILTDAKAMAGSMNLAEAKITGGGLLVTSSPAEAQQVVNVVRNLVDRLLSIPGVGLTPAAGVLRSIKSANDAERATVSGQIKVSTVEALLELLPALDSLRGGFGGAPGDSPASLPGALSAGSNPASSSPVPTVESLTPAAPSPAPGGKHHK